MKDKYEVYGKSDCPYCHEAEKLLKELKDKGYIDYTYIKVEDRAERDKLYKEWGLTGNQATMPQFFFVFEDGSKERIGDYTNSEKQIRSLYK